MTRLPLAGLTLWFVLGLPGGAAAQALPAEDTLRVSATIGLAASNLWYETPGLVSVRAPSSRDWTAMVDRSVSANWAIRVEAGAVSWAVGPRIEYTESGQRFMVPAGEFVDRRVTLQVAKTLRSARGYYSIGEFHAGLGVYWNGVPTDPLSRVTSAGASFGWDLLIPISRRNRVVAGVNLDLIGRGSRPVDLPYVPLSASLRVGARFGF